MFCKRVGVISDQIYHIWFLSFQRKGGSFGNLGSGRGGGVPYSQKNMKKYWQNFNFLVKPKNVPKGLKCKINTRIFVWIRGSQKGGWGGLGGLPFGKNSQIIPQLSEYLTRFTRIPRPVKMLNSHSLLCLVSDTVLCSCLFLTWDRHVSKVCR